jgi:hypothetical protein
MKMGMAYGLEKGQYCKKTNRWRFEIPGVAQDDSPGADALPPKTSARPNVSFKEMEAKHLTEDVFFPGKPEWRPITITLFDLYRATNPVWKWVKKVYDAKQGTFNPPIQSGDSQDSEKFIKNCYLTMYDGCGETELEKWVFEDVWPQAVNFQTLDMAQCQVTMCDLTIRYARAYIDS